MQMQQNRYLWVQLVGLAAVPLLLDVCLAGLASSGPAPAFGLQFWVIATVGIVPTLAMQWFRPFYLFSLPPLALKPAVLSEDQQRCLRLLKSWQIKALAVLIAACLLWGLGQLYGRSPQITPLMTPTGGLVSAAVAFFLTCTFLQISASAVRLLLVGANALTRVVPYEEGAIATDFLILGLRVNTLLPEPTPELKPKAKQETKVKSAQDQQMPELELKPESEPELKLEPEALELDPEVESDLEVESNPGADSAPKVDSASEIEVEVNEIEVKSKVEPASEVKLDPEENPESALSPSAEADDDAVKSDDINSST
ncbi:MAG: low-complexity tail membrane protein [Phormidesmis sp.]